MWRWIAKLSLGILLVGCTSAELAHTDSTQSLNGYWDFKRLNSENAEQTSIAVPSNWHSSGVEYSGSALYQTNFDVSNYDSSKRYWLKFDAVDYQARVALNNMPFAPHSGYFAPFDYEVTNVIKSNDNQLSVVVTSENDQKVEDWSLNKKEIKGVLNHHDTRPGGAWSDRGQEANSGGIWGSVALERTGPIAIKTLKFVPEISRDGETTGQLKLTLNSSITTDATIVIALQRHNTDRPEATIERYEFTRSLNKGKSDILWTIPSMKRDLWWPYDWGKPTLYDLRVEVFEGERILSHQCSEKIGFRHFEYSEDNQHFYVNFQPYFIRGTNYIGSQWLGEMGNEEYERDLMLMREANINSVRVHAHVAGKRFYDKADELGLIVWQDFPLQWGYEDSISLVAEAESQARDMIDMLYNHPSIAFWSAHNEPPWDATWMKYKYRSYRPDHNVELTKAVYQALEAADDHRIARQASYTHEHPWFGWYSGHYKDYRKIAGPPIISEFGAQSFPDIDVVEAILNGESNWPLNKAQLKKLSYHNYQHHETLNIAGVEIGDSLNSYIVNSQRYQRQVNKYAAEQLRLKKNKGIAAIYQFMFVDSWQAVTWAILDVERNPKPAYFAVKESFQPVLAVASINNDISSTLIDISVINDSREEISQASISLECIDDSHQPKRCWEQNNILIGSNSISNIASVPVDKVSSEFVINIRSKDGVMISSNHYSTGDY